MPRPPLRCDDAAESMQRALEGGLCGHRDECGETAQRGWNGLAHGMRAQQVATAPTAAHRRSSVCPGCAATEFCSMSL